ncbi:sigma-70 family RNA polymerase sigma factor [Membranicola marinus]|uniref:Sigma-70 family RNA polymerase sigma factor n=1 Tax=Membranihabitans marinus TaxID=1227546 RepID=A0A953L9B8_9BACT|nr:sigma-70 family RNA polymerase sigma factor [Membranihabitans marinus]MBY5958680.1 sigma-70 family RNA polymerase sigma factor [Membranihabitans marinus]
MTRDISIEISWKKYISGDKAVFGDVYLHYYAELYAYGRTITPRADWIDTAIQELFITLWQNPPKEVRSLDQYIFTSFRNQLYRTLKNSRKYLATNRVPETRVEDGWHKSAEDILIEDESNSEIRQQIQKALQSLPARRREAIYLKFFQNKTTAEISVIMNIREEMVRNYIYKGIKALRTNYSNQQFRLHPALILIICLQLSGNMNLF